MEGGWQVLFLGKTFVWVGVILFYLLRFLSVQCEWGSNSFVLWGGGGLIQASDSEFFVQGK